MVEEGQHMDDNLYTAARNPDTDIPVDVLNDQRFRYRTPGNCNNALHVAAQYGNQEFITAALTQLGEHRYHLLCQRNSKGETPLHLAAQFGHLATVQALLLAHDDVAADRGMPFGNQRKPCWSERDKNGDTPLHRALRYRHEDIAISLLDRDIQLVSVCNRAGESPAYLALESFCNRFIDRIVDADIRGECCVSFSGAFGQTVFHPARRLTANIISRLIEIRRGALLKAHDKKGKTVLHYAVQENRLPIVETLLRADNSLAYLQDTNGLTPLHIASKKGLFPMVETILELSPQSVEICDNLGKTVLHVAKRGYGFFAKCLNNMTMKGLVNEADNNGNTPLHAALINSEHVAAFQLLMVNGCNWRLKNNEGYSPLDLCKSNDKISYNSRIYFALRDLEGGRWEFLGKREWRRYLVCVRFSSALRAIYCSANLVGVKEEEVKHLLNKSAVAAAFLVPLTFTAAFIVPGGYDDTGNPRFRKRIEYQIFKYSDMSAFTAAVAILILCTFGIGRRVSKKQLARISIHLLQFALIAVFISYLFGVSTISGKPKKSDIYFGPILFLEIVVGVIVAILYIISN